MQFHEINGIIKPRRISICLYENMRFLSWVLLKSGFTMERVKRTVRNCSRSLVFKMNLWKCVSAFLLAEVEFHGSPRCLGPSSHSKTKHKLKKLTKLSESGLRRFIKCGQAHSNDERKITLSLNLHFIWDFRI